MKPTQNKSRGWLYIAIIMLVLFTILVFYNPNSNIEEIDLTTLGSKIIAGEVAEIDTISGEGRVLLVATEIKAEDFPAKADYTFSYTSHSWSMIEKYVEDAQAAGKIVKLTDAPSEAPFIEKIMPYIYIVVIATMGIVIFKVIAGSSGKATGFGKSKARVITNVKTRFTDVAGIDEEKQEITEVVEFLKNPKKFTEIGARIPKGVLLVGPPGTGKTLLAKAIAGESNVPFYTITGSDFVEMFVGVGAARVRDLFDQAKRTMPCIIFIDEIDAVGRQRGTGMGGGNDEKEQTLNQLLVQMDGFEANEGIIVIAATNRADVLDPALTRPGRFDRQIYVYPPDVKGREKIIEVHAKNKPIDENVDFKNLARLTSGFTGADIENLLNEAAILAARDDRHKVTMTDITEAINKVLMGPQKKSRVVTLDDKRITAYHEGGHALLGKLLKNSDTVAEISIIPRGAAGGYTLSRDDEDKSYLTKNKLIDTITMIMGGRIAEELVIKDITTGAQNDIQKATGIAKRMVTEWGMSKNLGFVNFSSDSEVFLGRDYQKQVSYSESVAAQIDEEVKVILNECYEVGKKLIKSNLDKLNELANLLLERETIYSEELDFIMDGKTSEEIVKIMNQRESEKEQKQKEDKIVYEIEKLKAAQETKIKTAQALLKSGIISEKELNQIKAESQKLFEKEEEKVKLKYADEKANNLQADNNINNESFSNDTKQVDTEKTKSTKNEKSQTSTAKKKPDNKKEKKNPDNKVIGDKKSKTVKKSNAIVKKKTDKKD